MAPAGPGLGLRAVTPTLDSDAAARATAALPPRPWSAAAAPTTRADIAVARCSGGSVPLRAFVREAGQQQSAITGNGRRISKGAHGDAAADTGKGSFGPHAPRVARPTSRGGRPDRSLRKSLGFPLQKGTATVPAGRRATTPETILEVDETPSKEDVTQQDGLTMTPGSASPITASEPGSPGLVEIGHADLLELSYLSRPRRRDSEGFISQISRLSVDIDQYRLETSTSIQDLEGISSIDERDQEPPLCIVHTSKVVSLLLRLVRSMPTSMQLRRMLEPLVREVLGAVYEEWSTDAPVAEMSEAEISPEHLVSLIPFYARVNGHRAVAEKMRKKAEAAEKALDELKREVEPNRQKLAELRVKVASLDTALAETSTARATAEKNLQDTQEFLERFKKETMVALEDFADTQHREQLARDDIRALGKEVKAKDKELRHLKTQLFEMTRKKDDLAETVNKNERQIARLEARCGEVPELKRKLARYEEVEAAPGNLFGVGYAARLAREVLKTELPDILQAVESTSPKKHRLRRLTQGLTRGSLSSPQPTTVDKAHTPIVCDIVCQKLKALPVEIDELKAQVRRFRTENEHLRQLIPVWNAEVAEDLTDALDRHAPVHRQIYSMKDKRHFAGLGAGEDVPPYLRTEGFIRHIFLSKGDCEEFMSSFFEHMSREGSSSSIGNDQLHSELHQHIKRRCDTHEGVLEFAYAFICSLEAYREDPDFELFELMLKGVLHPSMMSDQQDMLTALQRLVRSCRVHSDNAHMLLGKEADAELHASNEQVNIRILRACLEAFFPEKTPERMNSLRRALHATLQSLPPRGDMPDQDCIFVGDLFAVSENGSQSLFVEEIRRQHCYEIIDFMSVMAECLAESAKALMEERGEWEESAHAPKLHTLKLDEKEFLRILPTVDVHISRVTMDRLAAIAFREHGERLRVEQVLRRLRQTTMLRPERLWVEAEPKDVQFALLTINKGSLGQARYVDQFPRRCRGAKILDNPLKSVLSDEYSTADGLQKACLRLSTHSDEGGVGSHEIAAFGVPYGGGGSSFARSVSGSAVTATATAVTAGHDY